MLVREPSFNATLTDETGMHNDFHQELMPLFKSKSVYLHNAFRISVSPMDNFHLYRMVKLSVVPIFILLYVLIYSHEEIFSFSWGKLPRLCIKLTLAGQNTPFVLLQQLIRKEHDLFLVQSLAFGLAAYITWTFSLNFRILISTLRKVKQLGCVLPDSLCVFLMLSSVRKILAGFSSRKWLNCTFPHFWACQST